MLGDAAAEFEKLRRVARGGRWGLQIIGAERDQNFSAGGAMVSKFTSTRLLL